jgi:nuclear transcription factor Y, gamma
MDASERLSVYVKTSGIEKSSIKPIELSYDKHLDNLEKLLKAQKDEIENMTIQDFKEHQLPLARIKKIMKTDDDVKMISSETPALFAKACELFLIEITHRAWIQTEEKRRKTLQKEDIKSCISRTEIFDFLLDLVGNTNYS